MNGQADWGWDFRAMNHGSGHALSKNIGLPNVVLVFYY